MKKSGRILIIVVLFSLFVFSVVATPKDDGSNLDLNNSSVYYPNQYAELTTRPKTVRFIESTRAIPENNASSLDAIYYRLLGIKLLDPALSNLTSDVKSYWIDQILSFRNTNGGFGGWNGDSSSGSSTAKAIEALSILGFNLNDVAFDSGLVLTYVERLRNTLTGGYNSHLLDTDSDIFSTYYAVKVYGLLGVSPPTPATAGDVFIRAQNLDTGFVPSVEVGGFGDQTNNIKNIYWTSKVSTTNAAIDGANIIGMSIDDGAAALNFTRDLQAFDGGFTNDPYVLSTNIAYTATALEIIDHLGGSPIDSAQAISYILSLETSDGSFMYQPSSSNTLLKATYYAVEGLSILGSEPTSATKTLDYFVNWNLNTDGYGPVPGDDSSMIKTFDAVAALESMGKVPNNPQGIIDYVDSYRNLDGGYGILQSYMDSTSRAVSIHKILGIPMPNFSETVSFINSLYQASGAYAKSGTNSSSLVVSTYRAVISLDKLGGSPTNLQNTINYLKTCQNVDGGFGGYIGDVSDVTTTYRAVRGLQILGDSSFNAQSAINFLQQSQNPDGGFKRSSYDNARPANVSQAIYTYSSVLGLNYLGAKPSNVTGVFYYLADLRNNDGGFGEHHGFTSDLSYTFTSLRILSKFHEVSGFSVAINSDVSGTRSNYDSIEIAILGKSSNFNMTLLNVSDSQILVNQLVSNPSNITIDTTSWSLGLRAMNLQVFDVSGAIINFNFDVYIGVVDTNSPDTTSSTSSPISSTSQSSEQTSDKPKSEGGFLGNGTEYLLFITFALGISSVVKFQVRRHGNMKK